MLSDILVDMKRKEAERLEKRIKGHEGRASPVRLPKTAESSFLASVSAAPQEDGQQHQWSYVPGGTLKRLREESPSRSAVRGERDPPSAAVSPARAAQVSAENATGNSAQRRRTEASEGDGAGAALAPLRKPRPFFSAGVLAPDSDSDSDDSGRVQLLDMDFMMKQLNGVAPRPAAQSPRALEARGTSPAAPGKVSSRRLRGPARRRSRRAASTDGSSSSEDTAPPAVGSARAGSRGAEGAEGDGFWSSDEGGCDAAGRDSDADAPYPPADEDAFDRENDCDLVLGEGGGGEVAVLPRGLNRVLMDHQRVGVKWLHAHYAAGRGAILADDMGLGKTLQTICLIAVALGKSCTNADRERVRGGRRRRRPGEAAGRCVLVLCPASVEENWLGELRRWGHFAAHTFRGAGNKAALLERAGRGDVEVLIMSYDALLRHDKSLARLKFHMIVHDECHKLKSEASKRCKAAKALACSRKYGLTGTPIQNNLLELWCILDLVVPERMRTKRQFDEHFNRPIKLGRSVAASAEAVARGSQRSRELQKLLDEVLLQRDKTILSDRLRGKKDTVIFCPLTALQREVYRNITLTPEVRMMARANEPCDCGRAGMLRRNCCHTAADGLPNFTSSVVWRRKHPSGEGCAYCPTCCMFPFIAFMRKAADHMYLLLPRDEDLRSTSGSTREVAEYNQRFAASVLPREVLEDRLEGAAVQPASYERLADLSLSSKLDCLAGLLRFFHSKGDKVLVFSHSVQMLNVLTAFCVEKGYSHVRLDGTTPPGERQAIVDRYNATSSLFVFLISTKAGGLGLNVTSANRVVLYDSSWNPSHEEQAQDRAYRIGQTRKVQVFRLISEGTIEELMYMRQVYKTQIKEQALQEDGGGVRQFQGVEKIHNGELFGLQNIFQLADYSILRRVRDSLANAAADAAADAPPPPPDAAAAGAVAHVGGSALHENDVEGLLRRFGNAQQTAELTAEPVRGAAPARRRPQPRQVAATVEAAPPDVAAPQRRRRNAGDGGGGGGGGGGARAPPSENDRIVAQLERDLGAAEAAAAARRQIRQATRPVAGAAARLPVVTQGGGEAEEERAAAPWDPAAGIYIPRYFD